MEAIFIGKGLIEIAPIVSVITGSVKSIFGLINSISSKSNTKNHHYSYREVCEFIDNSDIVNKLEIYSLLINEFPGTRSQSVKCTLINVKDVIVEIESQLKIIKKKIDYNRSLWIFPSMRSYSVSQDLKTLEGLIKKLDGRIKSLKTVTEISKLWNSHLFIANESKNLDITYHNTYYPLNYESAAKNNTPTDIPLNDLKVTDLTSYVMIKK